jgi:hypothetical protein
MGQGLAWFSCSKPIMHLEERSSNVQSFQLDPISGHYSARDMIAAWRQGLVVRVELAAYPRRVIPHVGLRLK